MIASLAPPAPPHTSMPASRPSRLRGLSLLRRSGQNRSSTNSPPISPPERLALERSTSYPLNISASSAIAPGRSSQSSSDAAVASSVTEQPAAAASAADTAPENSGSGGSIPAAPANGTTAAASASTGVSAIPAQSASTGLVAPPLPSPAPETTSSSSSSGMARLRRAFSSQNGSQPAQTTAPAVPAVMPGPVSASLPTAPSPLQAAEAATRPDGQSQAGRDGLAPDQMPTIKFIPHQDPRSSKPSLAFAATSRTLSHEDCVIRVGRYSERDGPQNPPPGVPSAAPVGFKSKVVSRKHCEFWCSQGQWYIKDIKSSSGTFLNHIRLSQPNQESRPFPINDGDVVQLGIDFKGGEEAIFRCVKIRIECNRNWQKKLNDFNMTTHKRLRELNKTVAGSKDGTGPTNECSICLMSIAPCQSLFVAPCSHVWHFKCIRPMLNDHKTYPQFLCPNCRAVTDLEADIEEIEWDNEVDEQQDTDPENNAAGSNDEAAPANANQLSPRSAESAPPSSLADSTAGLNSAMTALHIGDTSIEGALNSQTAPVDMPGSGQQRARATTPSDGPVEPTGPDGPLTPRNDAGPFVFDGSAGRGSNRPVIAALAQSLEASATPTPAPQAAS